MTPPRRQKFIRKRKIARTTVPADLIRLAKSVHYGGSPQHKKNPGDFGLTPPASPRPDKTLCDGANLFQRKVALKLLREGIQRGLVSEQWRHGYPQNVWAVTSEGIALEAQLENPGNGTYHGYPLLPDDAFSAQVLAHWRAYGG